MSRFADHGAKSGAGAALLLGFGVAMAQDTTRIKRVFLHNHNTYNITRGLYPLTQLARQHGFTVDSTGTSAPPSGVYAVDSLRKYEVVIQNNASPPMDSVSMTGLRQYLEGGGGWIGIGIAVGHSGIPSSWPWYYAMTGAYRIIYPSAKVEVSVDAQGRGHPVLGPWLAGLPLVDSIQESCIRYNQSVRGQAGVAVLLTISEGPGFPDTCRMGGDHPFAWAKEVGQGRMAYSALGTWSELNQANRGEDSGYHQQFLWALMRYVAKDEGVTSLGSKNLKAASPIRFRSPLLEVGLGGSYTVEAFTPQGKEVWRAGGAGARTFDLSHLPRGLLLFRVRSEKGGTHAVQGALLR